MFSIKALAMATAVSAGVVFAMPAVSQAMPQSAPVKVDTVSNSNIVNVNHRKWHNRKWARYCRNNPDDDRCYNQRRSTRYYRYRYNDDYEPYYGYYRPYRPYYGPGIGLQFNID